MIFSLWGGIVKTGDAAEVRYEYKIVSLGSLSGLQNAKSDSKLSIGKIGEIEKLLNAEGLQGWDMVNIFAVRTTLDPNVFFVAMKRPLINKEETDGE